MRTALLACVLLAGCRTKPLDHPISDDFGVITQPRDMAVGKFDLSVPNNGMGCSALLDCLVMCQTNQCQNDCFNEASPDAQDLLTQALDCIYGFCQMQDGTRPPRCDFNFEDPADAGVGVCNLCLSNAFASLGGYECQPRNSPDCSPAQCQMFVTACQNN